MAAKKKTPSAQLRPIRRGTADNMERRASAASRARTGKGEGYDKIQGPKQYESYVKSGGQRPVDIAARAIRNMYRGTNVLGARDTGRDGSMGRQPTQKLSDFVQEFQDVVAESSLVDRFASRTLDAAAKKVATEQYTKYVGGTEDKAKARKKKK